MKVFELSLPRGFSVKKTHEMCLLKSDELNFRGIFSSSQKYVGVGEIWCNNGSEFEVFRVTRKIMPKRWLQIRTCQNLSKLESKTHKQLSNLRRHLVSKIQ